MAKNLKVKVVLNEANIRTGLLQSAEMQGICSQIASQAVSKLGSGYEVTSHRGKTRVNASIAAVTQEAKQENMDSNTVLKALGGVGK